MGSRQFLSWPAGWRRAMPWGFLVGFAVGAPLIVAQGVQSGWNHIDWCGTGVLVFFVNVGVVAFAARFWRDPAPPNSRPRLPGSDGSESGEENRQ